MKKAFMGEMAGPRSRRPRTRQAMAKCDAAKGLVQLHAMVAVVGFGEQWIFAALRPIEVATIDDHAAHGVSVAAHELGERMNDDVGAVGNGRAEVG